MKGRRWISPRPGFNPGLALCLLLLFAAGCQMAALPAPATPPAVPQTQPTGDVPGGQARLVVQVDPQGAQVVVDGQPRGASPITLTLPVGQHQIAVSAPGFVSITEPITLTAGQEGTYAPILAGATPLQVSLAANPPQVDWLGKTTLSAKVQGGREITSTQILLNGQLLGEVQGDELSLDFAPADAPGLQPGQTYTLTARAADTVGNVGQVTLALPIGALPAGKGAAASATAPAAAPSAAPGAATARPAAPAATATSAGPTPVSAAAGDVTAAPPAAAPVATATPAPSGASPAAVEPTTYRVESVIIPTYPYTRYLRSVVDPKAGNYPVLVFDRQAYEAAHPQPVPVSYTLLVLENRYVRLSILPGLGGRIYECVFKVTGNDEFYRNPVIKPTQWGPASPEHPAGANWWLAAGGLEWAFPVEEHGYEWATQWGYDPVTGDDGSVMVTVFTQDPTLPYVAVSITLPPDSAAFTVQPAIFNSLKEPFRFKWWDNAMLAPGAANKPGPDLRFIIPGSQVTVHSSGDGSVPAAGQAMSWPTYGGRDLSRLGNWRGWFGFFARPAAQAGFAGVYDTAANEGMVRIFPPDIVRGVKGFGPGWSAPIDAQAWTDDGSGYVELHGGLMPTFDDWAQLAAGAQLTWTETWYPAAGLGGLAYANADAAVNVTRETRGARVAVYPAHPIAGKLEVAVPGAPALVRQVDLAPDRPFAETVPAVGQGDVAVTLTDAAGKTILSYRAPPPPSHANCLPSCQSVARGSIALPCHPPGYGARVRVGWAARAQFTAWRKTA